MDVPTSACECVVVDINGMEEEEEEQCSSIYFKLKPFWRGRLRVS